MMSEHPTTGGYTKIATVVSADLPVLAQCMPGESQVRFQKTTVENAQVRYRRQIYDLEHDLQEKEEESLAYIE
jgi:allophanate hydrolase subunit 2